MTRGFICTSQLAKRKPNHDSTGRPLFQIHSSSIWSCVCVCDRNYQNWSLLNYSIGHCCACAHIVRICRSSRNACEDWKMTMHWRMRYHKPANQLAHITKQSTHNRRVDAHFAFIILFLMACTVTMNCFFPHVLSKMLHHFDWDIPDYRHIVVAERQDFFLFQQIHALNTASTWMLWFMIQRRFASAFERRGTKYLRKTRRESSSRLMRDEFVFIISTRNRNKNE